MSSTNQEISNLRNDVSNLNARILAVTPNQIVPVVVGKFVVFGCKVTEGVDNTDLIVALEGQASGDTANLNPDLTATPSRGFEFPNIASSLGGMFASNDVTATVGAAPSTGTARYDIAYVFAGKEGSGFAIQAGSPAVAVKDDFDTYGLDTSNFGEATITDPSIPSGALAVARIYVEDVFTGIQDARIADIRPLTSSVVGLSGPVSSTDNAIARWNGTGGTVLQDSLVLIDDSDNMSGVVDLSMTGDLDISHAASPSITLSDTTSGGVSAKLQVTDTLGIAGTTSDDDFVVQRNSITAITLSTSLVKFAAAAAIATTLIVGSTSITPDSTLHVHTATAGGITADVSFDDLVIENSGAGGASVLIPAASTGGYAIGSPSKSIGAKFEWNHDANQALLGSNNTGASLFLRADNSVTNLTLSGGAGSELAAFTRTVTAVILATNVLQGVLIDNLANTVTFAEGANNYFAISTINSSEAIDFGNATTNPVFNFLGTGDATFAGDLLLSNAAGPTLLNEAATGINPTLIPNRADPNTGVGWISSDIGALVANSVEAARWTSGLFRTAGRVEVNGAVAAGVAGIGEESSDGLQLTGTGSVSDIELLNSAGATALSVPTGTTDITVVGDALIGGGIGVNGLSVPAQASHIADPTGGATVDAESRTAIDAILVVIENVGFTAAA